MKKKNTALIAGIVVLALLLIFYMILHNSGKEDSQENEKESETAFETDIDDVSEVVIQSGDNKYNFTKGFFGTNGIHLEKGYTTPDISEALVKEAAMKRCREAYVLADSSKFGHVSSVTFARFEDAQIITDHISDPVFQTCSNIEEAES